MIRINLLSVRELQAEIGKRQDLTIAAVAVGATVALLVLVFLVQFSRSVALGRELAGLREEITGLEAKAKEVPELQKRNEELRQKLAVLDELNAKKTGPVRAMESLSAAAPERLWLTEFKENGGNLAITGMAIDNQTVADFITALSSSPNFSDVDLVETTQVQQDRIALKKFSLRLRLLYRPALAKTDGQGSAAGGAAGPNRSKNP
jgi:type IV pilus assembly protein PilN